LIESNSSQSPVMAPPSRSPNLPHINTPATTRELYTSATPQLRRDSGYLPRSPSASVNMRGAPVSPSTSSGFASPANMENASAGPPLNPTELVLQLQTTDGTPVRAEILGKVDKGFFMADNDWTCYRRNYFQLSCSFTVHPFLPPSNLQVMYNGSPHQVHGFSMSIAAVVDGRDGRAIDLVQHTPKRDKGPQVKPERVTLAARPHPTQQPYGPGGSENSMSQRSMYDHAYHQNSGQPGIEYTYERIQFKCATANNGRRRAAQQYYHLLVELSVDIGAQMGEAARWVKIAQRISAPVVVRGRSPGHYHSERRHSNASAGGSAGPNNGGGSYEPNNGIQRTSGSQVTISGTPSMVPSSGYTDSYESRSHHYSRANIEVPMEPIMSAEDIRAIDETDGYLYYPSPIYEGTGISLPHVRPHLNVHPQREQYQHHGASLKIKQEPGYSGYSLPSLTAGPPADSLGRHFGRFEGLPSSRGYYPTVFTNSAELHTL
jgi:meiosis-specific transcription factor NDT80